ncbi:CHAT domain-containing protein [Cyanobacteria bacterium FACHB-472]|nr:CHAT domain-containing protein [Cyanobacteria bacterium FACHB-472]
MKKILILTANPKNTDKLRLDEEVREIQAGLERAQKRDRFEIVTRWALRVDDLRRALLDHEPQIVHFSGHGAGEHGLALENSSGQMQLVSTESLVRLFKLFKDTIECVVLNACYSEAQSEAIHQHIDCVVGMNKAIGDRAAIEFAVGFYDALGAGRSYADAYEFGCSAIDLEGIPESLTPVLKSKNSQPSPSNLSPPPKPPGIVENGFRYDVYISYVDKEPDATWVWDTLLPRLEQASLRIAVSGDVETPGVARLINIEDGIAQSKRTIVVLSEAYLADNVTEFENVLVQTMGIQEGSYRLLPIKFTPIDPNRLPTRLSMVTTLDLVHPRRAQREFDRLVQALQGPLPRR